MDNLSRYFLRKKNLGIKDEFQSHISLTDIDTLRMARAYIVIAPVGTLCFIHVLRMMQEDGGFSRHFRNWASNARSQFNGGRNEGTWDPKTKQYAESKVDTRNAYEDI